MTGLHVPTIAGHTLEDLDEMFDSGIAYRNTPGWKPSGLALHGRNAALESASRDSEEKEKVSA